MILYYLASVVLVVLGSAFSVLRSASTIDYYRTIVRDGRQDPHAKAVMLFYNAGLAALSVGILMLLGGLTYQIFVTKGS